MNIYAIRKKGTEEFHLGGDRIRLGTLDRYMPYFTTDLKSCITQARRAITSHNSYARRYNGKLPITPYSRSDFEVVAMELDPFKAYCVETTNINKNTPLDVSNPVNEKKTVVLNLGAK